MDFKYFDLANWGRKNAFNFYKNFDDPYFNVTANVNVSQLLLQCKKKNQSFTLSALHAALKVVNAIDNFKMRFDSDRIKLYDVIHGGSTILYDDESFGFAYYKYEDDQDLFINQAQKIIEESRLKKTFDPSNNREDLIYFSALPWISFTSVKHAQDKSINPGIPRMSFGKYFLENGMYKLPVNVEVNHAFIDGFHLGLFFESLEKLFDLK